MALSGMTGFARREGALGLWTWAVEGRSVNGRNLETRYKGPPGFDLLERAAREASQGLFQRGQVNVSVQARRAEGAAKIRINIEELERLIALSAPYVADGRATAPSFDGLLAIRGVSEAGEETDEEERAQVEAAIAESVRAALADLKAARQGEGAALLDVLTGLVDGIAALTAQAESLAAAQGPALKERFAKRMTDLMGATSAGLEERIVQEAAVLATKADVREELDRLVVHVASARSLLAEKAAVGRKLDFLAQEFMRESNTLCSKSADSALTAVGLDLKAAVEQFREQIQNVE